MFCFISGYLGIFSDHDNFKVGIAISIRKVQLCFGSFQDVGLIHNGLGDIQLAVDAVGTDDVQIQVFSDFHCSFFLSV